MVTKYIDLQTETLSLNELKTLLGEDVEILLTEGDTPLARLLPVEPSKPKKQRVPGLHAGKIWMSDNFADPLPDEF